jgi:ubiquitin C-terminal hydrolase
VFLFLFSLKNEGSTCYVASILQCLTGAEEFCAAAKGEVLSDLLNTFTQVVMCREQGLADEMSSASSNFQLMAGCTMRPEFLDETLQQDAQEAMILFLQRVNADLPSPSIVQNIFSMVLRTTESCM